ncbi:MAG: NAD(+)/NADH kinase [Lachnospiraceae bacterium]
MDNFFIITNQDKDKDNITTDFIRNYLLSKNKVCLTYEKGQVGVEHGYHYTDARAIPDDCDCVIVIGGDGTLLQAARDSVEKSLPILGINLGTLGYLAEIDKNSIVPALDGLMADEYYIEERMMLEGEIIRNGKICQSEIALNDIVLSRNGSLKTIRFHIYVNGEFLNHYSADGIIVSTPTGSTAYNLSAGGPIVMPQASLFVLTPICPHTLNSRSIVLPSDVMIEMEVDEDCENTAVSFDADSDFQLKPLDRVRICCSQKKTKFVKMKKTSFLESLRRKMINQ